MNTKDIGEIRRRFTIKYNSVDRFATCYVSLNEGMKNIKQGRFFNLEEEVVFKYYNMMKAVMSGRYNNNLMVLPVEDQDKCSELSGFIRDGLSTESMIESFISSIKDNLLVDSNYVVCLFHDTYDVPKRSSDGTKLDESEEVYDYIVGAICPVKYPTPGLALSESLDIELKTRVPEIAPPVYGFTYPAFSERSADYDNILFYTKDASSLPSDLLNNVFGASTKLTDTQKQNIFQNIVTTVLGSDESAEDAIIVAKSELLGDSAVCEHGSLGIIEDSDIVEAFSKCADPEEAQEIANKVQEEIPEFTYGAAVDERELEKNKFRLENIELKSQLKVDGIKIIVPEDTPVTVNDRFVGIPKEADEKVTVNGKELK